MSFTFLSPAWLLLLLALPALWFFPRPLRGKEAVQVGLFRSVVLGLLVIALARPASLTDDGTRRHAIVLDRSASMSTSADLATSLEASFRSAAEGDDAITTIEVGLQSGAPQGSQTPGMNPSTSPLGDGLLAAARSIPAGSRGAVTLITDGLATDKRWGSAVAELSSRGIPVHTLRAPRLPVDARIVAIEPQGATLRVGTNATLEARIADAPSAFDIVLLDGDVELARDSFTRAAADTAEVTLATLDFEPAASGFLSIEARIESASDLGRPGNDALAITLAVQPPLRALYIGSRMQRGDEALSELIGPGMELIPTNPAELSANGELLTRADLVVLDDAPASTISTAEFEAIQAAVTEAGIGLFASGGVGSFGPGGWHNTPIEDLLPVEFVQKEEKRDPSTTLVIIIDTSGSMGGQRVQLAKEVARLAIRRLLPHDKVGLVEFYGAKRWAVPIQPASNAIEIERALNRLNAGGGTVILPAIEEAFYGLKNVRTRYKHVLILTDGGVETGAFEPLLRNMSEDGINVSTVLIGSAAHSEFLVTLANWGKGRFYGVPNRFNLPEILLKQPTTAKLPAMRPGPHSVGGLGGKSWWGDVDPETLPDLGSYVETTAKPGAHKVIETSAEGHPVLASWNHGLGRVTTLTTEPTGPASAGWQAWDGYGPLLARALERTARDSTPFLFSVERRDWNVRITARSRFADLGRSLPGARLVQGEDAIEFHRLAPGWFEADFFADPAKELRFEVGDWSRGDLSGLLVSMAYDDVAAEFATDPADRIDLALLSELTGGSAGSLAGTSLLDGGLPATGGALAPLRMRALWPAALGLALLIYLLEILHRRLVGGLLSLGRGSAPEVA